MRQILTTNEELGKKVLELEADNKHLRARLEKAERKDRGETGVQKPAYRLIIIVPYFYADHLVSDEGRKTGLEKGSKEAEGRHSSPEKLGGRLDT